MEPFERKVREGFGRQAFMTTLGAEIDCIAPGKVEIRMPFNQSHTQQDGFVHAGVISSIMDSACGYAAYSVAPEGCNVLTVEFKVSLLAPAMGKKFVARAQVKRSGKTLTVCAADAFAIDGVREKLIATMLGTIMTLTNRNPI
ncbi:MAG TPA: PaaI family thioesterase [Candidatus Angelobacter sp.]|nr:PaaI family thioesterase [Candidatus Angelobacter sp.]